MKSIIARASYIFLAAVIIFSSCKKETSCENCADKKKPPIAIAGPDQVITLPTDSISLDGNGSSDPDGTISAWLWTKISGPASLSIHRSSDSTTPVKNLVKGTYQFELKITDNSGLSARDTVQIIVRDSLQANRPPVACAGIDQTITLPVNTVNLDGSCSTDPDNNIISYAWSKISGPSSFNIANAGAIQTQVTNLMQGVYQFELKVTDADGLFSKDTVLINGNTTANRPPIANAGPDQTIILPTNSINLDGSGSTDPDNNITSYVWTKISGPLILTITNVNIVQTNVTNLVQGSYQFELKVTDAGGSFSKDTMTVTVTITSCLPTITDSIYVVQGNSELIPFGLLSQARSQLVSATAGNKILFAGGWLHCDQSSSRVDIFDMVTQTWSTAELSEGRYGLAATAVGNKILIGGGSNNPNQVTSRVDIYDASANSWSMAELSIARSMTASATIGIKHFLLGGGSI